MKFLEEIKELKNYIMPWFLSFLIIAFTIFAIGVSRAEILGYSLHLPVFSSYSIAVMFFEMVKVGLVPEGVSLIATSPSSAFISQTIISILGAFILTFPYLIYKIFQFLSPALYKKEKRKIFKILLPSTILFLGGVVFAYFILIPPTFRVLYSFNTVLGVTPFFAVSKFISWTLALMFTTGFMFLLPVFMYILSWIGIISSDLWLKNWKIALVVFLIISAIITPDGSGVTMALLSGPMMSLYYIGAILSKEKNMPKFLLITILISVLAGHIFSVGNEEVVAQISEEETHTEINEDVQIIESPFYVDEKNENSQVVFINNGEDCIFFGEEGIPYLDSCPKEP